MGAWGYGVFENDGALDWVDSFVGDPSRQALSRAWDTIRRSGYIQIDDAAAALAAAEVVAAMAGKPTPSLPPDLVTWAGENRLEPMIPDLSLGGEALHAIVRITEGSELKECIEESGGLDEWSSVIEDLVRRLGSVTDFVPKK